MTLANPRTLPRISIAASWQSVEGTPASTAGAQLFHCESADLDPQVSHIHPGGTTGSQFQKDTHDKAAEEPIATLNIFASRHQLPLFFESWLRGAPQVTAADLTESGDGSAFLDAWVLNGVRPGFNTDGNAANGLGTIYVSVLANTPGATDTTVTLFSDSARTAEIVTGVIVDGSIPGTLTLAESNSSGLSGTVDVASIPGASDTDIELDINLITYVHALQWTEFFTLWRDDGFRIDRMTDCVVTSLKLSAGDKGALMAEIQIAARAYDDIVGDVFTAALEDASTFQYQNLVIRSDVDGSPVRQFPGAFEFEARSRFTAVLGTDTDPQKLIAEGFEQMRGNLVLRPADGADGLFQQGLTDAEDTWDFISTLGSDVLSVTLDKVKVIEPKRSGTESEILADNTVEFIAVERQDASVNPLLVTLAG